MAATACMASMILRGTGRLPLSHANSEFREQPRSAEASRFDRCSVLRQEVISSGVM